MKRDHRHAEAFALMWYGCKDCGHQEHIWNSRDGVTPFGCGCPSCGKTLLHRDFHLDAYAPTHKPHRGQRFWRDGTADEAEAIMRRRIEAMREKFPCSSEKEAELISSARNGSSGEFSPGWPNLEVAE